MPSAGRARLGSAGLSALPFRHAKRYLFAASPDKRHGWAPRLAPPRTKLHHAPKTFRAIVHKLSLSSARRGRPGLELDPARQRAAERRQAPRGQARQVCGQQGRISIQTAIKGVDRRYVIFRGVTVASYVPRTATEQGGVAIGSPCLPIGATSAVVAIRSLCLALAVADRWVPTGCCAAALPPWVAVGCRGLPRHPDRIGSARIGRDRSTDGAVCPPGLRQGYQSPAVRDVGSGRAKGRAQPRRVNDISTDGDARTKQAVIHIHGPDQQTLTWSARQGLYLPWRRKGDTPFLAVSMQVRPCCTHV